MSTTCWCRPDCARATAAPRVALSAAVGPGDSVLPARGEASTPASTVEDPPSSGATLSARVAINSERTGCSDGAGVSLAEPPFDLFGQQGGQITEDNLTNFRKRRTWRAGLHSRGECTCWVSLCPGGEYGGSLPLSGGLSGSACLEETRRSQDSRLETTATSRVRFALFSLDDLRMNVRLRVLVAAVVGYRGGAGGARYRDRMSLCHLGRR